MIFNGAHRYNAALLALGLFFWGAAAVYAGGGKEATPELAQADEMIEVRDYSGAITVLTEFAGDYPDRFGEVQKRLLTIMADTSSYKVLADRLQEMIIESPEDSNTILLIIRELSAINADGGGSEQFIMDVEQMARLTVNRRELERILQNGRELLDRHDYVAALREYQNGFKLYREQMYGGNYDSTADSAVSLYLQNIGDFTASAQSLVYQFENARAALDSMPTRTEMDNMALTATIYVSVASNLDRLIEIKRQSVEAAQFLDGQSAVLEAAGDTNEERYFFSIAPLFIRGRNGEPVREGILGSIEGIWNIASEPLARAFNELADSFFTQALAAFDRENFDNALFIINSMNGFNRNSQAFFEKWTAFARPDGMIETVMNREVAAVKVRDFLKFDAVGQLFRYINSGCGEGSRYLTARTAEGAENVLSVWSNGTITAQSAISQELAWRRNYETYTSSITGIITELNTLIVRYSAVNPASIVQSGGDVNDRPDLRYFNETYRALNGLRDKFIDAQINSSITQYTIANRSMAHDMSVLRERFNEGTRLLSGVPLKLDDGTEITARYPSETLRIAMEITQSVQAQIDSARQLLNSYQNESAVISGSADIKALAAEARSIVSGLYELQNSNRTAENTARNHVNQADVLLGQAREFYNAASTALSGGNYDAAWDEAENSLERYSDSLGLEESASVRNEMNSRLNPLIAMIERIRYEDAVKVVRTLVNYARNEYFSGNFDMAEEILVNAEKRWSTVSAEQESEVEYWLTLVRSARFIQGGRTLSPTAPLYPEMSQLLSNARKNYEEGVRLINSNRRDAGLQMFAAAMKQTHEVRIMFPVNQDASILELQIDQITDPAAFNQNFTKRFQAALAGIKRGSLESFADLQDLAQINPRYPGINAALVQAEIDMGIRPAPPDTSRINRSNELAAAAQRMFEANISSQYPLVLENVNEALRLNPNNTLAMRIKDKVHVAMGIVQTADSYTEQEYLRAVSELQKGNNLLALSIVQRLLQRPENRDSVRLNELLQRIQSSM
ncbi:MAG: hypothetical protein LBP37_06415 [Spirochaetaceae bacterium]|jgi:hypothetical protein|nr:hypothetical protein [Spirochaetaceae bacterium]